VTVAFCSNDEEGGEKEGRDAEGAAKSWFHCVTSTEEDILDCDLKEKGSDKNSGEFAPSPALTMFFCATSFLFFFASSVRV